MDRTDNSLLESVDARTRLAGSNRMEILLFSLGTGEIFGINVFKVREVTRTPMITRSPNMPAGVEGLISLRGNVIPVVSLGRVLNLAGAPQELGGTMMVTEYNKRTLGFLVNDVDRIIRVEWDKVRAPEGLVSSTQSFITAITELPPDSGAGQPGRLVSILDVEQIMASTFGEPPVRDVAPVMDDVEHHVFFVDDSAVARRKIAEVLDQMGVKHKHALNGLEAWTRLSGMAAHAQQTGGSVAGELDIILVDAEMPEMDGYVLTRHIKSDPRFDGIPVVMHSSLSSEANRAMGKSVGVDAYVAKFDAEILADTLRPLLSRPQARKS
ncbi:MAG: chemotaxis protein CheW [Rhodocyclaceae bacterium]|jgi:two-component system chemotaxis response regulator CheV|uniref:Fused signal transduction protein/response regulator n=1 Tax=Candidatus Desulfobacillus denitrificans TaxID=2608985 RepID=A0A809R1E5_9PROT|nr:chemotaxis protein [Rhodocyclaceae bacterium]OQY70426.1 MAG: fused signal transduction protein/response regulator [Rhodocyclaceae bacterium UTPRO2]BBO21450.1 fused signal transduction protein/response regulator [Candidatus Desulfobacillus denitrificans]GIK46241.1 MAG: chemotaxis protein CheW [Betaproteobacteria bacterium]GJQ56584.1 MAG: chemotaxis protein CheW [Rhodocyclaceae bacterium]